MKKYQIIYADPAWKYNDKQNTKLLGGAEKHYSTMKTSEICELKVKDISDNNSVLFLWTTSPLLEESFKVVNAWGFKYKTSFIWDKIRHNMGHYNSVRHEILLIATKGSYTPEVRKLFDSVVSVERTRHSEKPQIFRDIINTIYPSGERIELFARQKIDGWDVWGNELDNDIEIEKLDSNITGVPKELPITNSGKTTDNIITKCPACGGKLKKTKYGKTCEDCLEDF